MNDRGLYTLENVTAKRAGRTVISNACATVPRGITCIAGPSGAGKSTLLRLLNRLADPEEGAISFEGRDIKQYNVLELRRKAAFVSQVPVPFAGSVTTNISYGSSLAGMEADIESLLEMVSLDPGLVERPARELSVGEQQRVVLARALALKPDVLLLDEPTSALDPQTTSSIESTLLNLRREYGLPMVIVTHDNSQGERLAETVMRLEGGSIYLEHSREAEARKAI